jgi:hypothetical protein
MTTKSNAIYGALWGLISIIPYSHINEIQNDNITNTLLKLAGLPAYIAVQAGAQQQMVFIGAPLVGAGLGVVVGKIKGN